MEQKVLSLSVLVALLMITGYMVYMIQSSMIKLEINDDGIKYERAMRKGLLFQRVFRVAPWKTVSSVTILDKNKGPLSISTDEGTIIYWNIVNPRENNELFDFVNSVVKKKQA